MANAVFANGREISCKAAAGKTICAMPDVCFTPPENPATPPGVPIPYPNTGMASDTTDGSKKVKISDKEVGLKNKSSFKKSMGDEAGAAAKKGVITSKNTGKVFFESWSMDVKIEGKNAVRHLDMTTNNHASTPGDTPPWPFIDSMKVGTGDPCEADKEKEKEACKEYKPEGDKDPCPPTPGRKPATDAEAFPYATSIIGDRDGAGDCLKARRCSLQPYEKTEKGKGGCCDGQTGHHLIEASAFHISGRGGIGSRSLFNCGKYNESKAPSICVEGTGHGVGTHGLMHTFQSDRAGKCLQGVVASPPVMINHKVTTVAQAQKDGAAAVTETFPESGCDPKCIEAQLSAYHETECGMTDPTQIKAVQTCKPDAERLAKARSIVSSRNAGAAGVR